MSSVMVFPLFFAFLLQGGGSELLDYVDTSAYWRIQGVEITDNVLIQQLGDRGTADVSGLIEQLGHASFEQREEATLKLRDAGRAALPQLREAAASADPEISMRARALLEPLEALQAGDAVTRLMAIRTLGERGVKGAVPALEQLTDSKEAFVAEYAARALAAIEGRPYESAAPDQAALARDIRRLPPNASAVLQTRVDVRGKPDMAAYLDQLGPEMAGQKEMMLERLTRQVLEVVGRIGNARLELVTAGAVPAADDDGVELLVIARGRYDRDRVLQFLTEEGSEIHRYAGLEFYVPEADEVGLAPVSDSELIAGLSMDGDGFARIIGDHLRTPPAALPFGEALRSLLAADLSPDPMFAALVLPERFRIDEAPFSVIERVRLSSARDDKSQQLKITGYGEDADALAQVAATIKEQIQAFKTRMGAGPPMMANAAGDMMAMLESLRIESDEASVSVSLSTPIKDGAAALPISPMMFFFGISVMR